MPANSYIGKITVGAGYSVSATADPSAGGQVNVTSPSGKALGKWFLKDTEVELTAVANGGYAFDKWGDDNTDNPRTVTINGDFSLTAKFKTVTTYNISASVNSTDAGTIIMTKNGESIEPTTTVFSEDDEVTLTAKHKAGYKFVNWTAGSEVYSTDATITLKNDNKTLTANFEAVTVYGSYNFRSWATNNVTSTGLVNVTWDEGDLVVDGKTMSLNNAFVADASVQIRKDKDNSTGLVMKDNGSGSLKLRGLTTNNWFKITSSENALKFSSTNVKKLGETDNVTTGGYLVSDETYIVTSGTEVELTFAGWTKENGSKVHSYIYAVQLSDETFYDLNITAGDGGSAVTDVKAALSGSTVAITVTPATGYMVDKVTVKNGETDIDVTTVTENQTYSFVMPAAAPTITVSFKENHTKIWDFSDWNADDEITTVTGKNGLYYRGGTDTRKLTVSANTSALVWNFPDGFAYQRSSGSTGGNNLILKGNGNLNIAGTLTPDSEADNTNNLTLAFTTTEAGTVYVAYRIASGKNANLYYKSSTGENYENVATGSADDNNNRQGMLFYTAPSGGTFFIGGNGDMNVYLVKFEPAETVYTLTETANPTGSGSVKKEIVYGDANSPSYYEAISNTFLSGTELRLTPAPAVGYGFSHWGDTTTDTEASKTITMTANQSVKVNFSEVKHQITVASAENGTVGLQVGGESVTLTAGKAEIGEGAEVTVVTTPTLFYGVKDIKVTKTGDANTTVEVANGKFTLPAYDVTVTVTFEAEKKYDATTAKNWTFDSASETVNSVVDLGDGLYLRGSSRTFTKVESGSVTSVTFGDETITGITNALQTSATFNAPDAGNTSATAISSVNSASATPMIAVNAASQGTVYIAASPVADGTDGNSQIRIYFSDGTGVPTQKAYTSIPSKDTVYTASYATDVPGTFYLGTTVAANIYAVKFVPTVTYAVSKSVMSNGDVTIDPASASAGQTVTITVTPADGYRLKSGTLKATYTDGDSQQQTLEITDNQFTMPPYAVTVSAEFELLPPIYGTYNFRTFATENITLAEGVIDVQATTELLNGVMTGNFTLDVEKGTISNLPMTLNDAFSASGVTLRKKSNTPASTALLLPRSSTAQLTINRLSAGDWFVIETEAESKLLVKTANANVSKLGSNETLSADETLESGVKYLVSAATSIDLYNNNVANAHIYTITISKDEAISDPAIGDLSEGKVTITAGESTASGSVKTYYTIDGSTPTASSMEYTAAVAIDQTRIVKAITINTTTNVVSNVVTKKIVVDAATPATTWDFTKMTSIAYSDDATTISYKGGSGSDFKYIVGSEIHAKMTWQQGEAALAGDTDNKYLTGTKPFSINDLAVGDKIYITYEGGALKVFKNASKGNSITIGETAITGESEQTFDSGAEIIVTAVDANDNYITLRQQTATAKITKIEINPVYQITNSGNGSEITNVGIIKIDGTATTEKTFEDKFARGTKVTLKATTAKAGGDFTWKDGNDNVLTPESDDGEGELTITLTDNMMVSVSYSSAKYWDFSEWTTNDEDKTYKSITSVEESKGLYYRGGAADGDNIGRSIRINTLSSALTWTFPDNSTFSTTANVSRGAQLSGNSSLAPAVDPNATEITDANNRALAFTTTEAGSVYVAYRGQSNSSAFTGRYYRLFYKKAGADSYDAVVVRDAEPVRTATSQMDVMYYTAPAGGSFFIGGDAAMNIYYIKFEPAETVYTLTETANPTGSGSVKKEIVYGDANSPSYYEAISNTFLSGTELRLTPAPAVGYGFSHWGDTTTDTEASKTITMTANQSVKVNFSEVKHQITVASAENGTVGLQVGGESVTLTAGKAEIGEGAEVTVVTTPTLFYGVKDIKVTKTGDANTTVEVANGKFTLPAYDVTVTVTFEAEKKYDATTAKNWTFDSASETVNSVVDLGDGLYLRGSSRTFTKVESGSVTSVTFGDETITGITNALQTSATFNAPDAGNTSATAISSVNSASATPMIAVNAASQGTVYIAASPVADGTDGNSQIRIYFSDGTGVPTQKAYTSIPSKDTVYTASYATDVPGTFYLGTTVAANIYAVKFVPTVTYAVSKSVMSNGDVTIDPASASAGQTVTITVTPADGYRLKSGTLKATYTDGDSQQQTLEITDNQFTMPPYAVTVSAEFELLPPIYGTYNFRTFATENITLAEGVIDVQATTELLNGVMTGNFTLDVEKGTISNLPMTLNDAFSASGVTLRKKSNTPASTALLLPRSSTAQLTINRLSAGDWFVIETEAESKLLVKTANANVSKLGSNETLSADETLESGVKYLVSAATSIDLYNNNVANAHIYTITISKDEAISDPAIGDLSEGKVTITAGESTASGSVKTYYTIDGSTPTASSMEYTAAVAIDQTRIVKAITINTTTNVVSNVVTKKIVVDAATPTTTWDFVNDATLNPLTYADETYNGYYINSSGASKGDGKFKYVTNEKIHAKLSWQLEGTETANASVGENGLSIRKGGRAFAINDLHVGDKIFITYSNTGETPLMTSINENHGCSISVDGGETVSSGNTTEIASGAEIEIKSAPEGYEYLVLMPADNKITIQKIEINPSFTITNLTASDSGVTGVKVIKVDDEAVDETFASGEAKSFIRGSKVTLQASYTAETGKSLLWLDAEDNELESNADGTLTLTVDADMKVKAQYVTGITVTEVKNSDNKMVARKLNNGLLEVTFDNNGRITAIKDIKSGKEVMASDDNNQRGYFNFNYRPSKDASVIDFGLECNSSGDIVQMGKTGSTQVELIYPLADAATPSHQTWKIGYVMKAGVSGIYTYAIMDGSSSYSELHEARYGWRVNPDIFNYAWVSDGKQGQMPTPTQMKNYVEEVQDATYKLNDGSIYTKYDWANFVKDDQLHGIMGDGIGAWLISPSTEWVNGGPQKQELTVHATDTTPIILQTMHSRHFGAGAAVLGSSDKKMFGPCLFYVNTGASQEAMIQDAKSKAAEETGAWPYSWFTNDNDIKSGLALTASERGTVTGTVNVNGGFETTKVQVVLTQGSEKPLLDANGYQYYAEATAGSSFEIKNVRPGTYTLYVYALNGDATGTYKKEEVTVSAGSTALGTIDWSPEKYGKTLWRIGEADRSTKGFKLSDEQRHYGLWSSVPTDDQTFTIGTNNEADDWYYAQVKDGGSWAIKFNCEEAFKMPLRLTIATAGAAQTPKLEAKMNDKLLNTDGSIVFSNDASIYRSGVLGGRDSLIVFEVPAAYMKTGENILNLKVNGLSSGVGGIMYDCIKLEASAEAVVSETRNWTFGDLATGTTYKEVTPINNEYYLRGSVTTNRNFTVQASTTQEFTFADGQKVSATNYLEANGGQVMKVTTANDAAIAGSNTAGDATNAGTPTFAFNTTKAGTVYAKISSNTADKLLRVYFANGSSVISTGSTFKPSTTDITEISYTSKEAGTFFICGAEAAFKIHAVRFVPTDEAVTYDLTMGSVENGTIKAIVGTDTIGAGNTGKVIPGSTVTLVAVPDAGYQLSGWKSGSAAIGDVPQSVMTTTVMPTEAMNVSAAFVAQPEAPTAVTAEKSWTFDSFATDTRLSGSTIYEYNGLYISGHRSDYANQATVKAGTASGDMGGTTVEASMYLSLAGGQDGNLAATRTVNSFTQDAVALKTGTTGTLYVLMAGTVPTEGDRYFNIYVNGEKHQTKITGTEPVVVSQVITDEEAQVFIATSGGQDNIYAIKFVPATMEKVEIENGSELVAIIDDEEATLADIDITEGTKAITISGTVDGKPVTSMTDNAFTEDNSEGLKAVDLSNTKIALSGDVRAEGGILASLPEETIVYLPTTSFGATGTNVVIKQSDGAFTCEDFQLFDEKPVVIPEGKEFKATDATLKRPFNMGKKCTVCLPYDFPATGGNFFEFTGISAEGKVQMTQRTGTLNSNTPYIFEPASDATAISAHSDTGSLEISISDAPETKNDAYHFTFKGTYDEVKWDTPQEDVVIYGFAAEARGSASIGQFVRGGVGASILPFRAYLEYNGTSRLSGVRTRGSNNAPDYLEVEWIYAEGYGEVTRIDSPEQQDAADAPIYNLRGQRVDDSYKGLVIKNGKKMVIK